MENKDYYDAMNRPAKIGLVYFNTKPEAEYVMAQTDQKIFHERRLNVVLARPTMIMHNECLIKVTGLNKTVTEESLYTEFTKCGEIERLVKSNSTTAYILFKEEVSTDRGVLSLCPCFKIFYIFF